MREKENKHVKKMESVLPGETVRTRYYLTHLSRIVSRRCTNVDMVGTVTLTQVCRAIGIFTSVCLAKDL